MMVSTRRNSSSTSVDITGHLETQAAQMTPLHDSFEVLLGVTPYTGTNERLMSTDHVEFHVVISANLHSYNRNLTRTLTRNPPAWGRCFALLQQLVASHWRRCRGEQCKGM